MNRFARAVGVVMALGVVGLLGAFMAKSVYINGKPTTDFVESRGKVYVSVDALRNAGAEVTITADRVAIQFVPLRGKMQSDAVEGVLGEWVSNGTWRIRVSDIQEITNPFYGRGKGYSLKLEVRNLTRQTRAFFDGLDSIQLIDTGNNQLKAADFQERYIRLAPADGFTARLRFGYDQAGFAPDTKPSKLLILFRPTGGKPALPNFRIFLTPEKEGSESSQG